MADITNVTELPADLPVPQDDGGSDRRRPLDRRLCSAYPVRARDADPRRRAFVILRQRREPRMEISPLLTIVIDRACGPLAERIEQRRMPALMRVHPAVFARIRELRETEIVNGYPLMFLGMELEADGALPLEGFAFAD